MTRTKKPTSDTSERLKREQAFLSAMALGGAGLVCVAAFVLFSHATALFIAAIVLGAAHGMARGFARTVAGLAGAIVAILLAPPLGRALEGTIGPLFGLGGLAARGVSVLICGVLVLAVVSLSLRAVSRRVLKAHVVARLADRVLGAGAGFLQGLLVAVLLLWVPLSLEPVLVTSPAPAPDGASKPENPGVRLVRRWSEEVRESSLAPVARATNPLPDARWLTLLRDFALVSRDKDAMASLMNSEAMKKIAELPSVKSAIAQIKADPTLAPLVERSGPVSEQDVLNVLNSPTVLKVLDESQIVQEFSPLAPELEKALEEAMKKVK